MFCCVEPKHTNGSKTDHITIRVSYTPFPGHRARWLDLLPEPLSAQELHVLRPLVPGRSNAEMARELVVSVNTVRTYTARVKANRDVCPITKNQTRKVHTANLKGSLGDDWR